MQKPEQQQEAKQSPSARFSRFILPCLIMTCLFAAPPTQGLLKLQFHLLRDPILWRTRLRELEIQEGELPSAPPWHDSAPMHRAARSPNDYRLQLGSALLEVSPLENTDTNTPQECYNNFRKCYGTRLDGICVRFPTQPGIYAHLLRFMTLSAVRLSREGEVDRFQTGKPTPLVDRRIGYADSWAAFDQAAAQGERLDPDNAYFPMMRAMGLFDAKRDAEGIAAVLRAGQKSRFEDYVEEEPDAEWALYRSTYGPTSTLVHQSLAFTTLRPHFGALRALARLSVYLAEKEEQAGHLQAGLNLRHAMMQCGVRMQEQGHTIGALVGVAIVTIQTNRPGGAPVVPLPSNLTSAQRAERHRDRYLAYLHKISAEPEALWFLSTDSAGRQLRSLLETLYQEPHLNNPAGPLVGLWILDMLLLINMLQLFLLCTTAVVCGRSPVGEKAFPFLISAILLITLLWVLPMQWAETLTQLRQIFNQLTFDGSSSGSNRVKTELSMLLRNYPEVVHIGEVLLSLLTPTLALIAAGLGSTMRRESFPATLSRSLQRGALTAATLLTVLYACALLATAQAERRAEADLVGITHNGVAYLQNHRGSSR